MADIKYIYGTDAPDYLVNGNSSVISGTGNDSINVETAAGNVYYNFISVSGGDNLINNSNIQKSTIRSGNGSDTILSGGYFTSINAGGGNNSITISNTEGGNTIISGAGNNTVTAIGAGNSVIGGDGADVFLYTADTGKDYIYDFAVNDLLTILNADGSAGSFKNSSFKSGTLTLAIDGGGHVIFKGVTASDTFNINGTTYSIGGKKLK